MVFTLYFVKMILKILVMTYEESSGLSVWEFVSKDDV